METLPINIYYELTNYLHPKDFAKLRIAFPHLNRAFTSFFIVRHILQKSDDEYHDKCFLKLMQCDHPTSFYIVKKMIGLNYQNLHLIQHAIMNLIQKPHSSEKVLWFLRNTDIDVGFRENAVLCWAVKKNDVGFVRKLVTQFEIDLSLGNFKVLEWAVRFFLPTFFLEQEIINLLLPHRTEFHLIILLRIVVKYDKIRFYEYFIDMFYPLVDKCDEFFVSEMVTVAISNHSIKLCEQIFNLFVTNLFAVVVKNWHHRGNIFKSWFFYCIQFKNLQCFQIIFENVWEMELENEEEEEAVRSNLLQSCLVEAVVSNCFSIVNFLIKKKIKFNCKRETILAYYKAIEINSSDIFNLLITNFSLKGVVDAQWLLFYCVRQQKMEFFEKLVEYGISPMPLPSDSVMSSTLDSFQVRSSQLDIDAREIPPPLIEAGMEKVLPPFLPGSSTRRFGNRDCLMKKNGKDLFLVYDTDYIFSSSLNRFFYCTGRVNNGVPESRFYCHDNKRKYGKNCRKMHLFLQRVVLLTMQPRWQHFLEWLEREAEGGDSCKHLNCINNHCFLEKKFNVNYPMGVVNVYHPMQEFFHMKNV
jgi:hypothetical protein